jgi:hypothetical protein
LWLEPAELASNASGTGGAEQVECLAGTSCCCLWFAERGMRSGKPSEIDATVPTVNGRELAELMLEERDGEVRLAQLNPTAGSLNFNEGRYAVSSREVAGMIGSRQRGGFIELSVASPLVTKERMSMRLLLGGHSEDSDRECYRLLLCSTRQANGPSSVPKQLGLTALAHQDVRDHRGVVVLKRPFQRQISPTGSVRQVPAVLAHPASELSVAHGYRQKVRSDGAGSRSKQAVDQTQIPFDRGQHELRAKQPIGCIELGEGATQVGDKLVDLCPSRVERRYGDDTSSVASEATDTGENEGAASNGRVPKQLASGQLHLFGSRGCKALDGKAERQGDPADGGWMRELTALPVVNRLTRCSTVLLLALGCLVHESSEPIQREALT